MPEVERKQMTFRRWVGHAVPLHGYGAKPLVGLDGEPFFAELALVRLFERDGWRAVWVDNYHSKFLCGNADHIQRAPFHGAQRAIYNRIVALAGGRAGYYDVMAWRGDELMFLELKGPGDRVSEGQLRWPELAEQVVPHATFTIVEWQFAAEDAAELSEDWLQRRPAS
jgi:hypothetical protein